MATAVTKVEYTENSFYLRYLHNMMYNKDYMHIIFMSPLHTYFCPIRISGGGWSAE